MKEKYDQYKGLSPSERNLLKLFPHEFIFLLLNAEPKGSSLANIKMPKLEYKKIFIGNFEEEQDGPKLDTIYELDTSGMQQVDPKSKFYHPNPLSRKLRITMNERVEDKTVVLKDREIIHKDLENATKKKL